MWQQGGSGGGGGANESFSGGGFLDNSQFTSPSETKKDNSRKAQNLFSVCVGQIMNSPTDDLQIGRVNVNLVKLVCRVKSVDVSATKIKYELEDDTGTLTGVNWVDADAESSGPGPLIEGTYCELVGSVRSQEGRRYLMILNAVPVTDPNKVSYHILSVIHDELAAHKPSAENPQQFNPIPPGVVIPGVSMNANASTAGANAGGTPRDRVCQLILDHGHTETGISKAEIMQNLSGQLKIKEIDDALEFLCNEGQIYTTIDDDHYKSTE